MTQPFWFNRMVEYWSLPLQLDLPKLVRDARIQMVQTGTFGPQFYSLADDPEVDRHWVGMPLVGVRENLAHIAEVIAGVKDAGARFVGQMSMSWHYGDHETGKGLFGAWDTLWTDDLLGPAPCPDPALAQERLTDGTLRCWPIEGRPYRTYCGCLSNPHWIAILKPMIAKAIDLGVDGLMVHHNFTAFCGCDFCRTDLIDRYRNTFDTGDLTALFGTNDLEEVPDLLTPREACPQSTRDVAALAVKRWEQLRRKQVFDDLYITYGRSLNPDLLVSQWYHKYDFSPEDERCLLPPDLWARDEDYIWYSQGGNKGISRIAHGYLADMGLPARFTFAAGGGRPFVINKYDYLRFRLSIAEAGANHAAAPAFHWGSFQEEPGYILEEYLAPLIRYHRFLADHDGLIRNAVPWFQAALVYPRRAEPTGESGTTDALKRLGRIMEDHHLLFEIILDEQLTGRIDDFDVLILPDIRHMSDEEITAIRRFVADGGRLILIGETGCLTEDGTPRMALPFADWQTSPVDNDWFRTTEGNGHILHIPGAPWPPESTEIAPDLTAQVYPLPDQDPVGQTFLAELDTMAAPFRLITDAPWYVRVRGWQSSQEDVVVLHWVNYRQDEQTETEVPLPTGPIQVDLAIPTDKRIDRIEWRYPEMTAPTELTHQVRDGRVCFEIPGVIVYGLSVVYMFQDA